MQRTAQDWLVLTELTHHNASAVGIVMALQFGPQLLLLPWTGFAADHFNQRKLLIATQATMGALALALGLLTVAGVVALWHVYVFAFLFGCAAAFDAPVRQTFVAELVGDADLPNAVALNSTSFNAARMVGPAVAGADDRRNRRRLGVPRQRRVLRRGADSLCRCCAPPSCARTRAPARAKGGFAEGLRYVRSRPDLMAILVMLFLIGTFGLNFPIFISTMAVGVFHADARGYGLLSSIMAIGTVAGALLARRPQRRRFRLRCWSAPASSGSAARSPRSRRAIGCSPRALVVIGAAALDLHQRDQQPDAALDRAADARTRDGAAGRRRARRHADRRADRRLGRRPFRTALGARRRRGVRFRRRSPGHSLSGREITPETSRVRSPIRLPVERKPR